MGKEDSIVTQYRTIEICYSFTKQGRPVGWYGTILVFPSRTDGEASLATGVAFAAATNRPLNFTVR